MIRPIFRQAMLLIPALMLFAGPAQAQSSPTVVFESGLGDGARVWRRTIDALPDGASVFTYDRPGYGNTAAAATPRDPCTIATELHARLATAGRAPPFVLVGHSLGGQYAYAFARLYPEEVAGLVLVDATPLGHRQAVQDHLPAAAAMLRIMRATLFSRTMRREFDAQEQCLAALPRSPLPFVSHILVSTRPDPSGGERMLNIDHELARTWLAMTGAGALEPVARSGHYIQRDRPEWLADAIASILSTTKKE